METLLAVIALYISIGMLVACWVDNLFNKSNKEGIHNIANNGKLYKLTMQEVVIIILAFPIVFILLIKVNKVCQK